jgi:hypothetical protein
VAVQDDAAPQADAQKDTGPLYSTSIGIYDVQIDGMPTFGKGLAVSITIADDYAKKPPTLQESPGTTDPGCKLWEYVPSEYAADLGDDEGSVQLTFTQTDMDAGTPGRVAPPCVFVPGSGYTCVWGQGVGGTWSPGPQAGTKVLSLTNAGAALTALAVGGYIKVMDVPSGGPTALHKGLYPIMAVPADNTVVVAETAGALTDGAETGAWVATFGKLPSPAFPNGMMSDDQTVRVVLTPGGGNHMPAFDKTVTPSVGDSFTLKAADATTTPKTVTPATVPFDGSSFKIECDTCNSSVGTMLSITATDADLTGAAPYEMPEGAHKVYIRCVQYGVGSITLPAEYSAKLTNMTRVSTYFLRLIPALDTQVNIVAGHGVAGFSTKP